MNTEKEKDYEDSNKGLDLKAIFQTYNLLMEDRMDNQNKDPHDFMMDQAEALSVAVAPFIFDCVDDLVPEEFEWSDDVYSYFDYDVIASLFFCYVDLIYSNFVGTKKKKEKMLTDLVGSIANSLYEMVIGVENGTEDTDGNN